MPPSNLEFQRGKGLFRSPQCKRFPLSPSDRVVTVPSQPFQSSTAGKRSLVLSLSISFCFTDSESTTKSMQILSAVFLPLGTEWLKNSSPLLSNLWKYFLHILRSGLFFSCENDSELAFFFFSFVQAACNKKPL